MRKTTMADEIQVLRFFETSPIETAQPVFNIIADKMRERLSGRGADAHETPQRGAARKRTRRPKADAAQEVTESPNA